MKGLAIALALPVAVVPVFAKEDSAHAVTGSVAFTTDYLFRGISRTDNGPAIQGHLQYIHRPWGVYLGAWASNVDTVTSDGEIEVDWTGGIRGQFTDTGIGWDLGAIYYHFPGDDLDPEKDYIEAKLRLRWIGTKTKRRVSSRCSSPPSTSTTRTTTPRPTFSSFSWTSFPSDASTSPAGRVRSAS